MRELDTISGLELEEWAHLAVLRWVLFVCMFLPNEPEGLIEINTYKQVKCSVKQPPPGIITGSPC